MSVKVQDIYKSYGRETVLNGLSFEARPGRILGFLGPNGAGKSTTMRILMGVLAPDAGQVWIGKHRLDPLDSKQREQIGYLAENNPLYPDMYVLEFLAFTGKLYRTPGLKERIREVVEQTGLQTVQHKLITQLSKGYRQRVGLAQAILHDPSILILDEPTSGLDPNQLIEIRQLIRQLGREKTVILSTHLMQEVEAICDDVAIIHQGNLVAQGALEEVTAAHNVHSAEELFVRLTR